jgi:hypothetical protein
VRCIECGVRDIGVLIEVAARAHPVVALGDGPPPLAWWNATQA